MLNKTPRIDLLRKRGAAHKVSVSEFARENQIMLVSLKLTDIDPYNFLDAKSIGTPREVLNYLNSLLFSLCKHHNVVNSCFIYSNKIPRVLFSEENQCFETEQQLIYMYNPKQVFGHKVLISDQQNDQTIQLLFLAQGDRLRYNAARFHQRVNRVLHDFAQQIGVCQSLFKLDDQQHLTFDIFAKNKGQKQTIIHGFRPVKFRYMQQSLIVPETTVAMTYAVATVPIKRDVLFNCAIDYDAPDPYNPLYSYISDVFVNISKQYNVNHQVLIGDAKIPMLRHDNERYVIPKGELVFLGCNNQQSSGSYMSQWDSKRLVDSMTIVFIANEDNYNKRGYGRFVNQICEVIKTFSSQLNIEPEHESVMVRFHQNISYELPPHN